MKPNTQQLNDLTIQVRRDILRMVHAVNSGHPGGLGCTEFLVALYQKNQWNAKKVLKWTELRRSFLFQTDIFSILQRFSKKRLFSSF
jgi:transketolase N-terminal domain/subunit